MCVDLCEVVCACLSDTDNVCVCVGDFFNSAMLTETPEKKKQELDQQKSKLEFPAEHTEGQD